MYRIPRCLGIAVIITLFAVVFHWSSATIAAGENHKPITKELIALLDKNPDIRAMLSSSITKASKINPDLKTNPVQRLEDYYDWA